MLLTKIKASIIGRPLKTEQLQEEKLPVWKALPILSSDALSSVAYGTEQILGVLVVAGAFALWYSLPISLAIVGLLTLLIISYRLIIDEYPGGGGAYIVSMDNLGWFAGSVAGASLLVDYILTVAVSVTAGTAAITSAFPILHDHRVAIACGFVLLIMVLNLRGLQESGTIFSVPTYLFIISIVMLVIVGSFKILFVDGGGTPPPITSHFPEGLTWFLLLRAFSSGCSALTGIEAISNATPTFRAPERKNAGRTLVILGILLAVLFGGISLLAYLYHLTPVLEETLISQIAEETFGRTAPYFFIQATTALILILAANTSYSGFPLLASIMAKDKMMPRMFTARGDRLNYSNGIIVLSLAAILLIIAFHGHTERLIPLYAIGVFTSFTLAQSGMVQRLLKRKPQGWKGRLAISLTGAIVTFIVLLIFAVTKFTEGAWIIIVILPVFVYMFSRIYKHYNAVADELRIDISAEKPQIKKQMIVLPVGGINQVVRNTVSYARSLDVDVVALYIAFDEEDAKRMKGKWNEWCPDIRLVIMRSRYRSVTRPLLRFIDKLPKYVGDRQVTVLIPQFIPRRWWHSLLHNKTALVIRFILLARKDIIVSTVPFHLKK
ncbi:amino acid/polyamine/organocation transporter, APC superfamily [Marininema mesophilum]|uniref:Amino acid/polyamine/organocation transporter, APC superfamily n=1 Tax=Marininema mesophilum TaxID=1048340 RepID=A0A1H2Y9Z4_9BACL|nr:APC family permease [Marininema mesophilum]SDX02062.1 amino acid/polyamine/organocation transporter, APC superfamily [Marininema mesophilum]